MSYATINIGHPRDLGPGCPNTGQWAYYVYFPGALIALSACLTLFVMFGYTGGV
jgi:hypothetical protein